ncbi:hypothetical protein SOPP22_01625 [Shewanella sp. OPT22]|nr:hypothetical protein SOPP22_01625 [Shewanella sp. OPT22]
MVTNGAKVGDIWYHFCLHLVSTSNFPFNDTAGDAVASKQSATETAVIFCLKIDHKGEIKKLQKPR